MICQNCGKELNNGSLRMCHTCGEMLCESCAQKNLEICPNCKFELSFYS